MAGTPRERYENGASGTLSLVGVTRGKWEVGLASMGHVHPPPMENWRHRRGNGTSSWGGPGPGGAWDMMLVAGRTRVWCSSATAAAVEPPACVHLSQSHRRVPHLQASHSVGTCTQVIASVHIEFQCCVRCEYRPPFPSILHLDDGGRTRLLARSREAATPPPSGPRPRLAQPRMARSHVGLGTWPKARRVSPVRQSTHNQHMRSSRLQRRNQRQLENPCSGISNRNIYLRKDPEGTGQNRRGPTCLPRLRSPFVALGMQEEEAGPKATRSTTSVSSSHPIPPWIPHGHCRRPRLQMRSELVPVWARGGRYSPSRARRLNHGAQEVHASFRVVGTYLHGYPCRPPHHQHLNPVRPTPPLPSPPFPASCQEGGRYNSGSAGKASGGSSHPFPEPTDIFRAIFSNPNPRARNTKSRAHVNKALIAR